MRDGAEFLNEDGTVKKSGDAKDFSGNRELNKKILEKELKWAGK